ncbi:MAG TPA: peptidoglycan-associated lipoprotein Pal [Gammaproteobacteria bacterium]|jgi:peptidoglycan-associated lipoprotein|nr:peptidoglycan-associated lipoprotein Pal [Gammaproteobacteria bacterium]
MKTMISTLFITAMLSLLAGCSSTGGSKDGSGVAVEDRSIGGDGGVVSGGASGTSRFDSQALNDPNSPLARRVIYFEYDSAEIGAADQDTLAAHAGFLASNPGQRITLEGHTDERGSREYNIALGDRRALSVQRILELNGTGGDQVTVVSYGEEKPAADGHSDAAWRLNRRVEIVYQ